MMTPHGDSYEALVHCLKAAQWENRCRSAAAAEHSRERAFQRITIIELRAKVAELERLAAVPQTMERLLRAGRKS